MKYIHFFVLILIINISVFSQDNSGNRDISDYYFPQNSFSERDDQDAFRQSWYGKHLDVLDNGNRIFKNNFNIIRFTCLRTFHRPFSIKILWDKDNAKLVYSMSNGAGGYSAGELIHHFEKELKKRQINNLLRRLKLFNFFNRPSVNDYSGFDGSRWIIEVSLNGKYKVIDRWTPRIGMASNIGRYIIKLSGEKIEDLY